jgi:pimeloyl-ACP methyl ester carboxylesterase
VPHLRGVGLSPAPADPEAGSYWRQAADLEALREHLGLERLALAAHSAGTRLAMAYAAQYPDRVARLLLITPPAGDLVDVPSDADALIDARRHRPEVSAALAAREAGPDLTDEERFNDWQRAVAPLCYAAWTAIEEEHARTAHYYLAAGLAYLSVDPPADLAERLSAVRAPVLVLGGARDCVTGIAPVMALARLFPSGDVVLLEQCGHYPWVERPAEFRQAAEAWRG